MALLSPLQLFARLGAKQSLGTLGIPLFTSLPSPGGGLCPGDMVEVTGGEGSGKSEFLLNIAARCVLPRQWCDREIGGREVEVVWMSTDHKFDILRLVAILEGVVSKAMSCSNDREITQSSNTAGVSVHERESESYQTLISSSLSRLHVVYCTSSTELALTLQSLRVSFLTAHPDTCAIVLDNVAEFYWTDRAEADSLRGAQVKQCAWVNALHSLVEQHHLVVFSARPFLFSTAAPAQKQKCVLYTE